MTEPNNASGIMRSTTSSATRKGDAVSSKAKIPTTSMSSQRAMPVKSPIIQTRT